MISKYQIEISLLFAYTILFLYITAPYWIELLYSKIFLPVNMILKRAYCNDYKGIGHYRVCL
jgi:hypothetical protein